MNVAPLLVNQQQSLSVNKVNTDRVRSVSVQNKSNISFGSRKTEMMMKALEDSIDTLVNGSEFNVLNKMKFHKLLTKALPDIMVPENYINCGRQSKVYRISDKYVAKVHRGYYSHTPSLHQVPHKWSVWPSH